MKNIYFGLVICILGFLNSACEKQNTKIGSIDIYLIDSYTTVDSTYEINETSVICRSTPLISYSEIISYDTSSYTFKLSDNAVDSIENLESTSPKCAFAVKANEELIYTGYFWPSYLSSTCQWIVIDPIMAAFDNELSVKLGYPGLIYGVEIPDNRNDSRIIEILKKGRKLK